VARGLAHQIKNPLTPIRISAHRLRSLPHPPGSRERELLDDCLVALQHEVSNLERIADEFARFARLPEPRPEPVDVVPLAREVAELYVGGHPGVHLHFETAPGTGMMSLDPDLTRQVISNLVKNAVEAMPAGGDLTVRVEPLSRGALNGGVRILVRDTGHGIPPEVRERLFTPYLTTKTGGTGLGLALSHRMVADQGGTLEVLTGSGAGTTFQVDFPAARKDRSET
jgi:two-component system nitrogen regulation sensor histidine kinase NtrY